MLLGEDGRHVWLSRSGPPPSREDVDAAGAALDAQGAAGWLVAMAGDYWNPGCPVEVVVVRRVTQHGGDDEAAVALWRKARRKLLA